MGTEQKPGSGAQAEETLKGSKNPRDFGNNGNPAQSAGRVTAREQDANPARLEEDPLETYPDLMPASVSKHNGGTEAETIDSWRQHEHALRGL